MSVLPTMAPEGFEERTNAFLEWFKALPGSTFSESLQIADLRSRGAGRGIVAARDIAPDTVLFTIPRQSIINTETSELRRILPNVFEKEDDGGSAMEIDDAAPLDSWSALILIMMFEHFRGENSQWKPYLDVLPATFDTPMFWSDEELEELQGSSLRSKIGRASADKMFLEKLVPIIRGQPDAFPGSQDSSDVDLVQLAHRMGSTIMSYAFDFENEDEREEDETEEWVEDRETKSTMGMVPMADILNSDAEYNAHVNYGDDSLTVIALRAIKAGEEILNYYGPHPNSELLRRYGYVTPKHSRYDVVQLSWEMVESAVATHLGLSPSQMDKIKQQIDQDNLEDTFVLERQWDEPNSDGTFNGQAKFGELPEDLQEQLKDFLKVVRKLDAASIPDKRKRDEIQHEVISRSLETLVSQYSTTVADDQRLLANGDLSERKRMATIVRLGEKLLLQEAKTYLAAVASEITADDGEAPRKRTKRSD